MLSINLEAMTGECSNCGIVPLKRKHGGTSYLCRIAENRWRGKKNSKGFTGSEYAKLEKEKRAVELCEICGCGPTKKGFHLDHDHVTGKFRGFLCHNCNIGLGMFLDDEENLLCAIEYLRRHRNKVA
jgi:Recombination endonuclease VII